MKIVWSLTIAIALISGAEADLAGELQTLLTDLALPVGAADANGHTHTVFDVLKHDIRPLIHEPLIQNLFPELLGGGQAAGSQQNGQGGLATLLGKRELRAANLGEEITHLMTDLAQPAGSDSAQTIGEILMQDLQPLLNEPFIQGLLGGGSQGTGGQKGILGGLGGLFHLGKRDLSAQVSASMLDLKQTIESKVEDIRSNLHKALKMIRKVLGMGTPHEMLTMEIEKIVAHHQEELDTLIADLAAILGLKMDSSSKKSEYLEKRPARHTSGLNNLIGNIRGQQAGQFSSTLTENTANEIGGRFLESLFSQIGLLSSANDRASALTGDRSSDNSSRLSSSGILSKLRQGMMSSSSKSSLSSSTNLTSTDQTIAQSLSSANLTSEDQTSGQSMTSRWRDRLQGSTGRWADRMSQYSSSKLEGAKGGQSLSSANLTSGDQTSRQSMTSRWRDRLQGSPGSWANHFITHHSSSELQGASGGRHRTDQLGSGWTQLIRNRTENSDKVSSILADLSTSSTPVTNQPGTTDLPTSDMDTGNLPTSVLGTDILQTSDPSKTDLSKSELDTVTLSSTNLSTTALSTKSIDTDNSVDTDTLPISGIVSTDVPTSDVVTGTMPVSDVNN